MQKELLGEVSEIKFDPSYHDLYNDLFYKNYKNHILTVLSGGEGGIRTLDPVARIPVFETGTFNHSATSPMAPILADPRGAVSRNQGCSRSSPPI